jgi:ornithine--oxo-acid transaminase
VYERAEGAYLYDRNGNQYLDFLSGFGAAGIGRNHPVVSHALRALLDAKLADLVQFDCPLLAGLLAERLLAHAPGLERAYFCNSGTEAVEAALKFARCATGRPRIIYCDRAFHGLTTGSLSVTAIPEFRRGFDPLLGYGTAGAAAALPADEAGARVLVVEKCPQPGGNSLVSSANTVYPQPRPTQRALRAT